MQRRTLLCLSIILPALLGVGCSSSRGTTAPAAADPLPDGRPLLAPPIADDSAVAMVRRLESDPLAAEAPALRGTLFAWVVASPRLAGFSTATAPVDELQSSRHLYKEELILQYIFGGAAFALGSATPARDLIEQQTAGIRSMIAAYRNILQHDPSLRDPFLDRLDDLRRRGELRGYLQKLNGR